MPQRPKVLIVGDSISMGYTPHAAAAAADVLDLVRHDGNGGDSSNVLAHLGEWLETFQDAGLVHVNCGLHDIKRSRPGGDYQVPIEKYRENLRAIADMLTSAGRSVVWATTTPVIDSRHAARGADFDRYQQDVTAYNNVAKDVMSQAGAGIDDLHAVVVSEGVESCVGPDGVHMTDAGYRLLGRAVADACRRAVGL
ncbi:MAG: SGNH/GDSL hydrolase family protein [Phycisphaerae bacterium]